MQTVSQATATPASLTDEERRDLWAAIETADQQLPKAIGKARPVRVPYDRSDVQIRVVHPGGGITVRSVYSHDLNHAAMSLLHPGYLHTGTAVQVTFPRRLGGEEHIHGKVTSCRYVSKVWHACEVTFDEAVPLRAILSQSELERLPVGGPSVAPAELTGEVLLIDAQEIDRLLFCHLTRNTKLKVSSAPDIEAGVRMLNDVRYDLVVLDLQQGRGAPPGDHLIQRLRQGGYTGQILVTSADLAPLVDKLRAAGIEWSIAKPYDEQRLTAVLATALQAGGEGGDGPLYSDLAGQDGTEGLLAQFGRRLGQLATDLRQFIAAGNVDEVRLCCVTIRGSAGGFGFPSLSAAAGEAVKALDACGDVGEAGPSLAKLESLCRRVTTKKPTRVTSGGPPPAAAAAAAAPAA